MFNESLSKRLKYFYAVRPESSGLTKISRYAAIILIGLWLPVATSVSAENDSNGRDATWFFDHVDSIPGLVSDKKLSRSDIPNPHWRDDGCQACHNGDPGSKPVPLRNADVNQTCSYCHDSKIEHSYIHPVGVTLDPAMIERMPKSYQSYTQGSADQLPCLICHDLVKQCLKAKRVQSGMNPAFLRNGPFRTRTEQCYLCHDSEQYERRNAHEQMSANGRVNASTCVLCHEDDPDTLQAADGIENLRFYVNSNLSSMCTGCHRIEPHPRRPFGNRDEQPNHLVKPTEKMLKHMQETTSNANIILPLEPGTGQIFCGTCHNPHQQGVLQNSRMAAGAGSDKRLRAPIICGYCHDV